MGQTNVKVMKSKILVQMERSSLKEESCEILKVRNTGTNGKVLLEKNTLVKYYLKYYFSSYG